MFAYDTANSFCCFGSWLGNISDEEIQMTFSLVTELHLQDIVILIVHLRLFK